MSVKLICNDYIVKKRYKNNLELNWNMDKFWDYNLFRANKNSDIYKIIYLL